MTRCLANFPPPPPSCSVLLTSFDVKRIRGECLGYGYTLSIDLFWTIVSHTWLLRDSQSTLRFVGSVKVVGHISLVFTGERDEGHEL